MTVQFRIFYLAISNQSDQESAVGVATGYGLDGRGIGGRVPVGVKFSSLHVIQTGSGAHSASNPMGTGGSFHGVKRPGVILTTHIQLVPRSRIRGYIYIYPLSHTSSWRSA
jgi:hypothetical protein